MRHAARAIFVAALLASAAACSEDARPDGPRADGAPGGDAGSPECRGLELCDGVDNDCDSNVDETVAAVCGECVPACMAQATPGASGWTLSPETSDDVVVDDDGALTLGRIEAESFAIWVANTDEGTVSKLDSRTNVEIARYPSARPDATNLARPWDEMCNTTNRGNCPSRTAVDQAFDAFVANRAFGNQGTVSKIANEIESCVDRNMNGMIDTSHDENGDGVIDLTDPIEFVGTEDECLLWTVPVGPNDGVPRALSIGLAPPDGIIGDVWVGLNVARRACVLDPMTGETRACVDLDGVQPYGAAADGSNRIWFVDRSGTRRDLLGYVSPTTMTFRTVAPVPDATGCATSSLQGYGLTIDGAGRVYVASSSCAPEILRYDPDSDTWAWFGIPLGGTPRGLAADEASLWVGISHNDVGYRGGIANRVEQFDLADMAHVATHRIPTGTGPVGVGVSFDGSVWAICQTSNSAARLDPATGAWIEHPVGLKPYTYSDFIGYGLNVFVQPRGEHRFVVEGCATGETAWQGVRYSGEVPPGTFVEVWARSADSSRTLESSPWIGAFTTNPATFAAPPGPIAPGHYLEVELRLSTEDRRVAPRVFSVDVAFACDRDFG